MMNNFQISVEKQLYLRYLFQIIGISVLFAFQFRKVEKHDLDHAEKVDPLYLAKKYAKDT